MKHHIAVKFIAILLASLTLFVALASGTGITGLASLGLYDRSVEELYQKQMQETYQFFSAQLVHRYASLNYGQLPEAYLNQYYGDYWLYDTLKYGYYFYEIIDEKGNVVESTTAELPAGTTRHTLYVTEVNYRQLLDASPQEVRSEQEHNEYVSSMNDILRKMEAQYETVATITEPEETVPLETAPDGTITAAPEATAAPGSHGGFVSGVNYDRYYDYETGQQIEIAYTIRQLPPYTVVLYLLPEAVPEAAAWNLLKQIWVYRTELFYVLAMSLLGFAICAVYLCCAAGKKPGREDIHAEGLNRIPLDLYLGGSAVAITCLVWMGFEGGEYLLQESPNVFVPAIAILGYLGCLIFVAFCFACAAQFKTPGYYWAKNSVTGRCFRLAGILWNKGIDLLQWIWARVPKVVRWCFSLVKKLVLWAWDLAKNIWLAAWGLLRKWCGFGFEKIGRLYGLLPLMWQWVLGGMALLMGCVLAWANRYDGWGFVWLLLSFSLVLYGASCFGILLEGARRMSKGDLETKVSNQFLFGAFKDFGNALNALANVAVVAAQKQMKSERMKTELITNVSHDIKTPLTSIINYVDLLEKPHTDEEQTVYLEVLSRQSNQLKKLIEDLMEMSKASTGNMNVDISSVNAGEAIHQALGEFADKLEKAQLTPVFRQPEEPIYMLADGRLAWRVMSNLLSNAVKYALPGTRVYIDLMELEGKVIISMKNISRESLNVSADELLERFVRGDASRNTEGSGLGLNIAQSLMDIQKGQLQLLVDGDLFKVTLVFPGAVI